MNPYLKYANLGFQLLFFIIAGYFLGLWIAQYFHLNESKGSAFGMLFFIVFGLAKLIRDVMKESES